MNVGQLAGKSVGRHLEAKDFYWGSAFKLSGTPSFKGLGTARPETWTVEIDNGALICMIMNINDPN